jgi:hypothetical protein
LSSLVIVVLDEEAAFMSDIGRFISPLVTTSRQKVINMLVSTNRQSQRHGLVLTEENALQIVDARNEALKTMGRLELGFEVINKIIRLFCPSPYINQTDYANIICELVEAFYYMKNETLEQIGDDDLIYIMRDLFDNRCFGSIELLTGRELEKLTAQIRAGRYYGRHNDEEEV